MSRPKYRILTIAAAGETRFLLVTRGYAVMPAETAAEALALLQAQGADVALLEMDGVPEWQFLLGLMRQEFPETQVVLRSAGVKPGEIAHGADWFLGKGSTPAGLMEAVRVMALRKRGPKKRPAGVATDPEAACG